MWKNLKGGLFINESKGSQGEQHRNASLPSSHRDPLHWVQRDPLHWVQRKLSASHSAQGSSSLPPESRPGCCQLPWNSAWFLIQVIIFDQHLNGQHLKGRITVVQEFLSRGISTVQHVTHRTQDILMGPTPPGQGPREIPGLLNENSMAFLLLSKACWNSVGQE